LSSEARECRPPDPGGAPAPPSATLAVDAGQTGTRAAVVNGIEGRPLGRGPGVRHLQSPGGVDHAAAAIATAAERAGLASGIDTLCIGLSGFVYDPAELEPLATTLRRRLGLAHVVVASDVVTSYLGALGPRPGVVVAAGTGTVALAADGRGAVALVDGWGHLLGDAGSGFAIGRAGLSSALRALDGRGGSEDLRVRAEHLYGPLHELPTAIYGGEGPARRVAAFAEAVADAARAGDAKAREIWADAASELASTAIAAAARALGSDTSAEVSWAGSLFAATDLLRTPFTRRLAERAPRLRVIAPAGSSLDGAARLAGPEAQAMFPGLVWMLEGPAR
jgi:N-acetylglucosamine kinase-like BadF-type ATPase